jgi:hypothetical protein
VFMTLLLIGAGKVLKRKPPEKKEGRAPGSRQTETTELPQNPIL